MAKIETETLCSSFWIYRVSRVPGVRVVTLVPLCLPWSAFFLFALSNPIAAIPRTASSIAIIIFATTTSPRLRWVVLKVDFKLLPFLLLPLSRFLDFTRFTFFTGILGLLRFLNIGGRLDSFFSGDRYQR